MLQVKWLRICYLCASLHEGSKLLSTLCSSEGAIDLVFLLSYLLWRKLKGLHVQANKKFHALKSDNLTYEAFSLNLVYRAAQVLRLKAEFEQDSLSSFQKN